jgi:nitrite reductase/ring-hydroxylating ferredoxin subunit
VTAAPRPGRRVLCRIDEIEDGEGKGLTLGEGPDALEIVVVREGERVYGYVNSCPHTGTPLEWIEDEFMSEDGGHILCHTHGALFRIEDGHCVAGPCAGDALTPVAVERDGADQVLLVLEQPRAALG